MTPYLQHIEVHRYGALRDVEVGPFAPGLNVVYGPNEAGKTTIASLIGGVLFGWEEAHGVRNTYAPEQGERAGTLVWAYELPASGEQLRLSREGGSLRESSSLREDGLVQEGSLREDGLVQDGSHTQGGGSLREDASLQNNGDPIHLTGNSNPLDDIDRNTYQAIFSLTSDELRTLRDASDVTSRLLAAGSGTSFSPAGAYIEIEQRIAAHTSPDSDAANSVVNLTRLLEEKQAQVRQATEQNEIYKQEDRELRELSMNRADASARMEALNRELEDLATLRADMASIDEKVTACRKELDALGQELGSAGEHALRDQLDSTSGKAAADSTFDPRLLELDAAGERALRDQLDEFAEAREKAERIVDTARENSATSTAAYEALIELDEESLEDGSPAGKPNARNRTMQAAVSIVPTLAFIGAGIPLFVHGRQINSLSFTALGIGLVVLAFLLAVAAIAFLFRPNRQDDALADRRKDAQWVMLQDRKKLDSSQQQAEQLEAKIAAFLENVGLAAANGSLRQARSLLDDARDARLRLAADEQRMAALELRMQALRKELLELAAERQEKAKAAGMDAESTLRDVDDQLRAKSSQRDALLEVADGMSMRYGQLSRTLEQAREDRTFDELKLEYHQIRARLRDAKHELVELLLAKRMLERSIASWESRNQPEVYALASRLFALITDDAWVEVAMSASGSIVAKSAGGDTRKPRHLSLGTCQQLYLALRIALLLCAKDVGRAIPVIADDILVNFDSTRRRGAARALAELARSRQVIVFTCHEETLAALRDVGAESICKLA